MSTGSILKLFSKSLSPNQRDSIRNIRDFSLFGKRVHPKEPLVIYYADGSTFHGGLTDRFKGIISIFYYCLKNNLPFRINWTSPTPLIHFLTPSIYDWRLRDLDKISNNYFEAKCINLVGDPTIQRFNQLKSSKQIHCFANRDVVTLLNALPGKQQYTWSQLFRALFRPTQELDNAISGYTEIVGKEYISVVYRFQNMLGDFEENNMSECSESLKKVIVGKCKKALLEISETSGRSILVTSDSRKFLSEIYDIPTVHAFPEKTVHIDYDRHELPHVYMKSFVDFYMISRGCEVYSLGTKDMYKSDFPLYAAKLGEIPFHRITIE